MINSLCKLSRFFVVGGVSAMLAGCSISNPTDNPFTVKANANGKPTVWDCSVVQMASPPRYACSDNKTYTAFQLRDARLGVVTPNVATK
jgi:poly-beta-hydroxyalkanoate depolymerase